jgi:hypothetical protein
MKSIPQHVLNRRSLVGSAIAGVACVASGVAFASGNRPATKNERSITGDALSQLTETAAHAFIGSNFDVLTSAGRARATLRKVESLQLSRVVAQEFPINGFELAFEVIESLGSLPTGLCQVSHPRLGTFDLFLAARPSVKGGQFLGATFSRFA